MAQVIMPMANRIMKIVVMVVGSMPRSFGAVSMAQFLESKPRVERVRVQQLRSRGLRGLGDALGEHVLSLAWLSAGGNRWRGVIEHLHDQLGHRVEFISAESASRQRRRTDPYARGVPGAVWIGGHCIPVGDNPRIQ